MDRQTAERTIQQIRMARSTELLKSQIINVRLSAQFAREFARKAQAEGAYLLSIDLSTMANDYRNQYLELEQQLGELEEGYGS